ncbi:MAG: hypothetical protein WHS63_04445 [Tenuifilum sp.]|uniref:hypothetical protein n=1 Tax=Tenuifilum sp. TaxID=2760880 RepID=UPI0030A90CC4
MKKYLIFSLALTITLAAAVYQRLTGPTHPKRVSYLIDSVEYKSKLIRSGESDKDTKITLHLPINAIATLHYKRFKVNEDFSSIPFLAVDENRQEAYLPKMPAAAKLEYYIEIVEGANTHFLFKENPITIRYKDPVPAWVLIPHILFMFLAMLFSNLTGLQATFNIPSYKQNITVSLALLFLGGLILGPIVQKYAFGAYWTGFPFGYDLTDNKTLIAFAAWLIAFITNRKNNRPVMVILAAVVTIIIFSIPHSLFGSELDYESGKVITGFVHSLCLF